MEEKDKPLACIEISSGSIKLLIGDLINNKPVVYYATERPINGFIKDGVVVDKNGLVNVLEGLKSITDESAKLKISISEVCLLLPPLGLRVYQSDKITNVVSATNEIGKVDIANVISLVRKETIPPSDEIVDIIPLQFVLDNETVFSEPPIGKKSSSLGIRAMIHTLPKELVESLKGALISAGFRIRKCAIAPYCAAEVSRLNDEVPENYFLVDCGSRVTSVTFIGKHTPYASSSFYQGGDDLTERMMDSFGLSKEVSEDLKIRFGYSERALSYDPPLAKSENENKIYQRDLNSLIGDFFDNYSNLLRNALNTVLKKCKGDLSEAPVYLIGGAADLPGSLPFFESAFPGRNIIVSRPKVIGAYNNRFISLLGLAINGRRYAGTLEDNRRGIPSVERVAKIKKPKRKGGSLEDNL